MKIRKTARKIAFTAAIAFAVSVKIVRVVFRTAANVPAETEHVIPAKTTIHAFKIVLLFAEMVRVM